jgi:predicted TPR repeat methyltransferase
MLEKARSRHLYDELVETELTSYLKEQVRTFDLIVFSDTLCYFGDLGEIIAATAGALRPNGMLVFSAERLPWKNDSKGYRLHPHGRYSHSRSYVDSTMTHAGFGQAEYEDVTLRMEIGEKVTGLIVSAVHHNSP